MHHDKEASTYTLLWNGKRRQLLPMKSTAPPSSTSLPSSEESQKEQQIDRAVMSAAKAKTEDIKDGIAEQVHGKADMVGTHNIDQGNAN